MIDDTGLIADWVFLALAWVGIGALLLMVMHEYRQKKH